MTTILPPIVINPLSLVLILPIVLIFAYFTIYRKTLSINTIPSVVSVSLSGDHNFSKPTISSITLLPGLGVEGDAHCGTTVQHRSRLHIRPPPPNLRQVHLIASEKLRELELKPGDLGENITTRGIDLLGVSKGTKLYFVDEHKAGIGRDHGTGSEERLDGMADAPCAMIQGLRNPCPQIEKFRTGLQQNFLVKDGEGKVIQRLAGVMGTVEIGGEVRAGMKIVIERPKGTHVALECV